MKGNTENNIVSEVQSSPMVYDKTCLHEEKTSSPLKIQIEDNLKTSSSIQSSPMVHTSKLIDPSNKSVTRRMEEGNTEKELPDRDGENESKNVFRYVDRFNRENQTLLSTCDPLLIPPSCFHVDYYMSNQTFYQIQEFTENIIKLYMSNSNRNQVECMLSEDRICLRYTIEEPSNDNYCGILSSRGKNHKNLEYGSRMVKSDNNASSKSSLFLSEESSKSRDYRVENGQWWSFIIKKDVSSNPSSLQNRKGFKDHMKRDALSFYEDVEFKIRKLFQDISFMKQEYIKQEVSMGVRGRFFVDQYNISRFYDESIDFQLPFPLFEYIRMEFAGNNAIFKVSDTCKGGSMCKFTSGYHLPCTKSRIKRCKKKLPDSINSTTSTRKSRNQEAYTPMKGYEEFSLALCIGSKKLLDIKFTITSQMIEEGIVWIPIPIVSKTEISQQENRLFKDTRTIDLQSPSVVYNSSNFVGVSYEKYMKRKKYFRRKQKKNRENEDTKKAREKDCTLPGQENHQHQHHSSSNRAKSSKYKSTTSNEYISDQHLIGTHIWVKVKFLEPKYERLSSRNIRHLNEKSGGEVIIKNHSKIGKRKQFGSVRLDEPCSNHRIFPQWPLRSTLFQQQQQQQKIPFVLTNYYFKSSVYEGYSYDYPFSSSVPYVVGDGVVRKSVRLLSSPRSTETSQKVETVDHIHIPHVYMPQKTTELSPSEVLEKSNEKCFKKEGEKEKSNRSRNGPITYLSLSVSVSIPFDEFGMAVCFSREQIAHLKCIQNQWVSSAPSFIPKKRTFSGQESQHEMNTLRMTMIRSQIEKLVSSKCYCKPDWSIYSLLISNILQSPLVVNKKRAFPCSAKVDCLSPHPNPNEPLSTNIKEGYDKSLPQRHGDHSSSLFRPTSLSVYRCTEQTIAVQLQQSNSACRSKDKSQKSNSNQTIIRVPFERIVWKYDSEAFFPYSGKTFIKIDLFYYLNHEESLDHSHTRNFIMGYNHSRGDSDKTNCSEENSRNSVYASEKYITNAPEYTSSFLLSESHITPEISSDEDDLSAKLTTSKRISLWFKDAFFPSECEKEGTQNM